jgi:membrane fusion protein
MSESASQQAPTEETKAPQELDEQASDTTRYLSWNAIQFIHSPSSRVIQWTGIIVLVVVFVVAVLASVIEMDIAVEGAGEIIADKGVPVALSPSAGIIRTVSKSPGAEVKKGDILAVLSSDMTDDVELTQLAERIKSLLVQVEGTKDSANSPTEALLENSFNISDLKIYAPTVIQSVANLKEAISTFNAQNENLQKRLSAQLAPTYARIETLEQKLSKMRQSKNRDLLTLYIESTEEELGKLRSQVLGEVNREGAKLSSARTELIKVGQVALGNIEHNLEQTRIRSPADGIMAVQYFWENSAIAAGEKFATILPANAKMITSIKIPSKDVVRVKTGQTIYYKVDAFPYQNYGLFTGKIVAINQLTDTTKTGTLDYFIVQGTIEPPAHLSAELRKEIRFVVGMKFIASAITDRKPIRNIIRDRIIGAK